MIYLYGISGLGHCQQLKKNTKRLADYKAKSHPFEEVQKLN